MNYYKIFFLFVFLVTFIISNNVYAKVDLKLNCKSHIAMNAADEKVIFENNSNQKVYPASTTKILTAILAIENLNLDDNITITEEMVNQIPFDSSVMGIKTNEIYTVKDLLYGLMLVSGNDVAIVFADIISGNMENFSILMNEKLEEIGCKNTHFVNAHGYHDDNHYTTAYDMALLFNYCLKNDTFNEIITTKEITITPLNNKDRTMVLENSNAMLFEDSELYLKEMQGGKTGFTYEASGTFIGYVKKDDMTIIIGSFGGGTDENGKSARFSDTAKISNYIFNNFEKITISKDDMLKFPFTDLNISKIYNIGLVDDLEIIAPKNSTPNYTIDMYNSYDTLRYNTPVVGKVTITYDGLSYTKDLKVISSKNYYDSYTSVLYLSIIIIILLIIEYLKEKVFSKNKNYKYRHKRMLKIKTNL